MILYLLFLNIFACVENTYYSENQHKESIHSEYITHNDSLLLVFWNLENFFEPNSKNAPKYWTTKRFYTKCDAIAKTLLLISDDQGSYPDIIAFAEVENLNVLRKLINNTALRKLGYKIVHYDSPDRRGIDCALLYRSERLQLYKSSSKHICDSLGAIIKTRDILLAEFRDFAVLVNHHPSQIGGKSTNRLLAMQRLTSIADSIGKTKPSIAVGDFNEQLWPDFTQGSLKYNGNWEKIDGYFTYPSVDNKIQAREIVFTHPLLLMRDTKYGGLKPKRTFIGPRYNAGVSDHLPIIVWFTVSN